MKLIRRQNLSIIHTKFIVDYAPNAEFEYCPTCDGLELEGSELRAEQLAIYALVKRYGLMPSSPVNPGTYFHAHLFLTYLYLRIDSTGVSKEAFCRVFARLYPVTFPNDDPASAVAPPNKVNRE